MCIRDSICPYAILVDEVQGHSGVSFSNSQIFGRVTVNETNSGPVRFTGCGFFGATREPEPREPIHFDIAGSGHVSLDNCHLITLDPKNTATTSFRAEGGGLSVMNCLFMDAGRTHFDLRQGLQTAVIVGNTFQGAIKLVDTSNANVQVGLNAERVAIEEDNGIVVDNLSEGKAFHTEGDWGLAKAGQDYMGSTLWAQAGGGQAKAMWQPDIREAGEHTVYVWHGGDPNRDHASDAPFTVHHADGESVVRVNQRERFGQWVELGAFRFHAGTGGYVTLSNDADGNVLADAVKFVPVD